MTERGEWSPSVRRARHSHTPARLPSGSPTRRAFVSHCAAACGLTAAGGLAAASALFAKLPAGIRPRLGFCTFTCHRHWQAVRDGFAGVRFSDTSGFIDYALSLGAQGVQTSVSGLTTDELASVRATLERAGAYYEGDVRLPEDATGLEQFADQIRACRAAGATVARTVLLSGRRYETFRTREAFDVFHSQCVPRLRRVEPVLKRQGVKLAVENHKDLTTAEFLAVLDQCDGELIGINVDTGNNLALLEEPHEAIAALAPRVLSVHLKDMAVQPHEQGFLLSEVPLGTGLLDLPRVLAVLATANPEVNFSLEMATRDPLLVPCLTDGYWATRTERHEPLLQRAMQLVTGHPPRGPVPMIQGRSTADQLADEEAHNRTCLDWYSTLRDV